MKQIQIFILKHKQLLTISAVIAVLVSLLVPLICYRLISPNKQFILGSSSDIKARDVSVGLVLGAGVNKDGKPFKELQARLDVAAAAYVNGDVSKLILSGDNRFESYNEPAAMQKYLVDQKQIPESDLQVDYAGRSTYESCERATRIFGQSKIVIFSAESHLPRAIYLCRHFGIETYGISSGIEADNSWRREMLARIKAVFNIYVIGEKTVLGDPIKI